MWFEIQIASGIFLVGMNVLFVYVRIFFLFTPIFLGGGGKFNSIGGSNGVDGFLPAACGNSF